MEKELKSNFPYDENEESFNQWFRTAAKKEWDLFLNEGQGKNKERYDVLLGFLYEHGTQQEIDTYLKTLRRKGQGRVVINIEERLTKERPDLKFY